MKSEGLAKSGALGSLFPGVVRPLQNLFRLVGCAVLWMTPRTPAVPHA
ncbi:hypothetical protein ACLESD_21810 [Pyxidicoccus sp. 3LFB2]